MMRGGHGHGGHGHATSAARDEQWLSAEELRRRRGELDRLIEERELAEARVQSEATPVWLPRTTASRRRVERPDELTERRREGERGR
jgi:hypothetical protein